MNNWMDGYLFKQSVPDTRGTDKPGWIAVDLDGSLARYDGWKGPSHIGEPLKPMVTRIRKALTGGADIRILTARVAPGGPPDARGKALKAIARWCKTHLGQEIPITWKKNREMIELWDDRAVQLVPNTGGKLRANRRTALEKAATDRGSPALMDGRGLKPGFPKRKRIDPLFQTYVNAPGGIFPRYILEAQPGLRRPQSLGGQPMSDQDLIRLQQIMRTSDKLLTARWYDSQVTANRPDKPTELTVPSSDRTVAFHESTHYFDPLRRTESLPDLSPRRAAARDRGRVELPAVVAEYAEHLRQSPPAGRRPWIEGYVRKYGPQYTGTARDFDRTRDWIRRWRGIGPHPEGQEQLSAMVRQFERYVRENDWPGSTVAKSDYPDLPAGLSPSDASGVARTSYPDLPAGLSPAELALLKAVQSKRITADTLP